MLHTLTTLSQHKLLPFQCLLILLEAILHRPLQDSCMYTLIQSYCLTVCSLLILQICIHLAFMHTYPSLGGLSGSAEHHHPACHTTTVSVDYTCTQFVKCVRYSNDIYIYIYIYIIYINYRYWCGLISCMCSGLDIM